MIALMQTYVLQHIIYQDRCGRSNDYDSAKPNSTSYIVDSRARHTQAAGSTNLVRSEVASLHLEEFSLV